MKSRIKGSICTLSLIFTLLFSCAVVNAEGDFVIDNGILISYTGSEREVTVPSEVIYIGDNAFRDNTAVEKITLGESVMGIGNCAFYGCTSLSQIEQTESVGAIGAYAFYNTPFLNNQKDEFVTVNDILVEYNGASSQVAVPSNIRVISPYTFAYDNNVTSVIVNNSVEEIGEGAFYMCSNLASVEIPETVSVIGGYAFYDTPWLENDSREFLVEGKNILVDCKSEDSSVELPDNVSTVGTGAFYMSNIESVTFSKNTKVIGMRSFMGCENLKEVNIPDGVLLIDTQAFFNCQALEKASVSRTVEVVNSQAFVNSGNLTIYGTKGSKAEEYAIANDIPFDVSYVFGDVDGDGIFNILDATALQKYIAEIYTEEINMSVADANGDGEINITDATYLQTVLVGLV